jgi:predicted GIY-YIG superfamily endonuclease
MSSATVYVLKLEQEKFYVGKTLKDPQQRFEEHKINPECAWLKTYAPLAVVESRQYAGMFDEDSVTKAYMLTYGIENVRGGTYTEMWMPEHVRQQLTIELRALTNVCFRCGQVGHFSESCTHRPPTEHFADERRNEECQLCALI